MTMSGSGPNRERTSLVQQVLRFLRLSKTRSENDAKCSRIIEKNKNVERFKEEYPIARADYTQHRWRASLRHNRKTSRDETNKNSSSAPAAEQDTTAAAAGSCGCQIVKAFTRAKDQGDEAIMESIRKGTFVPTEPCEHALAAARAADSKAEKRSRRAMQRSMSSGCTDKPEQIESNATTDAQSQFKRRSSLRHSVKKRLSRLKRSATEQVLRQEYSALVVESDTDAETTDIT